MRGRERSAADTKYQCRRTPRRKIFLLPAFSCRAHTALDQCRGAVCSADERAADFQRSSHTQLGKILVHRSCGFLGTRARLSVLDDPARRAVAGDGQTLAPLLRVDFRPEWAHLRLLLRREP